MFNKSSYFKNGHFCLKEFKPFFTENKFKGTLCVPIETQGTSLNWFLFFFSLPLKKDLSYQRWLILNTDKKDTTELLLFLFLLHSSTVHTKLLHMLLKSSYMRYITILNFLDLKLFVTFLCLR